MLCLNILMMEQVQFNTNFSKIKCLFYQTGQFRYQIYLGCVMPQSLMEKRSAAVLAAPPRRGATHF